MRPLVHVEIAAHPMSGAVIEIQARLPQGVTRQHVQLGTGSAGGKAGGGNAAMWPFKTRVKRSRISSLGRPMAMVRVTSVVPSRYCAPESTR